MSDDRLPGLARLNPVGGKVGGGEVGLVDLLGSLKKCRKKSDSDGSSQLADHAGNGSACGEHPSRKRGQRHGHEGGKEKGKSDAAENVWPEE